MRSLAWLVGLAGSLLIALAIIWPPWKPATSRDTAPLPISAPTTLPASPAAVMDPKSQPVRTNDPPPEVRSKQPIPPAAVAKNTPESIPRRAVQQPQLLQDSTVQLPEDLADSCRGRTIGISVVVGEDGRVKRSKLLSYISPDCDRAALSAAEKFIFEPAKDAHGQPVESSAALSIDLL
jgi:outer membrane biosynthesis protein TonB